VSRDGAEVTLLGWLLQFYFYRVEWLGLNIISVTTAPPHMQETVGCCLVFFTELNYNCQLNILYF